MFSSLSSSSSPSEDCDSYCKASKGKLKINMKKYCKKDYGKLSEHVWFYAQGHSRSGFTYRDVVAVALIVPSVSETPSASSLLHKTARSWEKMVQDAWKEYETLQMGTGNRSKPHPPPPATHTHVAARLLCFILGPPASNPCLSMK